MSSPSHRKRPTRSRPATPPGLQPSDIANAILDLSNQAEWTKLAIGQLKPTAQDAGPAAQDRGDRSDRDACPHDDRPSR